MSKSLRLEPETKRAPPPTTDLSPTGRPFPTLCQKAEQTVLSSRLRAENMSVLQPGDLDCKEHTVHLAGHLPLPSNGTP